MAKKNKLIKTMEALGYIFPTDENSVVDFEKIHEREINEIQPKYWNNPIEILRRGYSDKINLPSNVDISTLANLAQAARQGKEIPAEIRKKMLEDRKGLK